MYIHIHTHVSRRCISANLYIYIYMYTQYNNKTGLHKNSSLLFLHKQ